ncbi:MAG: aldo/keto reductase [Clostridia bacterium]|jgi:diketogulonate reductase-like aldo/keto reductase|nr:aldo/keto reductase [Clostridia bacterium]MBR0438324.1 aldo/keto reductase [Clostridia bacterium]MBR3563736.1 aldo/keto reductase [Clostridia bacterium]MBR4623600.1 aldo/keto reductase [Clostridia bacterium]
MEKTIKLLSGLEIPKVFFGTYRIHDRDDAVEVVKNAVAAGYRGFDSATFYADEDEVRRGLELSGKRDECLVTTKVWNDVKGYDGVMRDFEESEKRLGRVDIYMLHWPLREFSERWRALEDLFLDGRVKAIGVSNFKKHHINELMRTARILPMIDQIEAHCRFMDYETIRFCQENAIAVQAWRPLMRTGDMLQDEGIAKIAARHGRTPAQICLRFLLEKGVCVVPKTVREERMRENIDLFDFSLTTEDLIYLQSLNYGERTAGDPDEVFE